MSRKTASRFVYAIGGDSGTVAGAYDTVEFASVDLFGTISPFAISPNKLRAPRTLGGTATIGRYVYYVGGNSGGNASAAVERALILSPKETPIIADLDFALVSMGLAPGEYRYRVSAVFAANDSDNPDGESLASDAFTVRVPAFTGRGINVSLTWRAPVDSLGAPLPNVVGYRVYRSPVGGLPGTETLIGSTTGARSFIDDGSATASMQKPVPLGSTGAWAQLPNLGSQREGLAIAWAEDPTTAGTFYLYAIGGRQNTSTALRTYEYLTITTNANGQQTVGAAWIAGGTNQLAVARWLHGAWVADNTVATIYPAGSKFVFAGGGQTAAGGSQTTVEAAQVLAGGALGPWNDSGVRDFGASSSGYGVAAANGSLYTFGGQNGGPSVGSKAAVLSTPPALASGAWNDEGLAMTHGRFLLGSAVQSAFIFLIGGQTDEPSLASKTTEMVIW